MRTYVQWDDAFEEPTPTLFQLIRLIRGFNSTDLLEVFSKQGLLYQYRVGKGEPIQVPRGLFTQEVAERIIRKHNGRPSQFFSRATILFAQLLILRFGNPKSHRQTKEDIPTFSKILLACSSLAEGPLAAGVTAENIDASMGYLFGNFLLNKGHDLASKMGRHWAFLTKYSRALPQHNVADQIADALGERPELQAALVFGLLGRYIYDDETLAKLTTEPANFLTALTYFDGMPKEIAASGRTLIGTISGDQARHRECLRRGKHPRSAYDCRTIFDMPLLRVGEVLFPLDTSLLAEQYSSGQYARAYTALAPSRKHTRLADSWGKLFEHHIAELLKSSLPGALGKRLFIESEHGFYNVDFIIRDGESLVFLEATISGVPALRALSGD
jgi:hypothetical protein